MKKLLLALSTVAIFGCSDNSSPTESATHTSEATEMEGAGGVNLITSTIISDPANDPYSVENMSKAMRKQVLAKSGADSQEVEQLTLEPNYLYVRFLANGKKGVSELKAYDTSLVLFKHPLDYKPIRKPAVYIDPSLPDSIIPMFATVPANYKFGPTKYEIIKKLFLVEPLDDDCDDDECSDGADSTTAVRALAKKASDQSGSLMEKLNDVGVSLRDIEWESLSMTGNLGNRIDAQKLQPGESPVLGWSLFSSAKKLGGQLKFKDDLLGVQPLVGVRVTGGYSYYWREAHTDKDGKFKIPEKWSFKIDFEANFDSDDFLLEDGHSWYGEDLEIEHNNYKSDWNETFTGDKAKWCVVWTAAYQYWYGDNFGLKRPRQNKWWNWSLDIEVYYKNKKDYKNLLPTSGPFIGCGAGESLGKYMYNWGGLEEICISTYGESSRQIYSTVIHEVGHTSHYWNTSQSLSTFFDLPKGFRNTYTRGLEYFFQKKRYHSVDLSYFTNYTGLIPDLIDNDGKTADGKKNIDKVKGFSMIDIEKAIFATKSLNELKNYLKKNYPSGKNGRSYTNGDLDKLFDYWINI
ncbi:MAG: hypothetical protein IKS96_13150 [Fibrobacter sp.]|nr:hypothetical protein [Fibrobacter sp.]